MNDVFYLARLTKRQYEAYKLSKVDNYISDEDIAITDEKGKKKVFIRVRYSKHSWLVSRKLQSLGFEEIFK